MRIERQVSAALAERSPSVVLLDGVESLMPRERELRAAMLNVQ